MGSCTLLAIHLLLRMTVTRGKHSSIQGDIVYTCRLHASSCLSVKQPWSSWNAKKLLSFCLDTEAVGLELGSLALIKATLLGHCLSNALPSIKVFSFQNTDLSWFRYILALSSCLEGGLVHCTNTRRCRKLRKRKNIYRGWNFHSTACFITQSSFLLTGSCPENPFGIGHCAIQCLHDSECRGLKKCCKTACGGTQCIRGKRRKPPQKPDCSVCAIHHVSLYIHGSGNQTVQYVCV